MRQKAIFLFTMLTLGIAVVSASCPSGTWSGLLKLTPQVELKLIFKFKDNGETVTMDVPAQGAKDVACEIEYPSTDSLRIRVPQLTIDYKARFDKDNIKGVFRQGPITLDLSLRPANDKPERPQTPTSPFPYSEKEVSFNNPKANVYLSGTLTLPEGFTRDNPVVLLISGSGAQNRDEEIFDHKPFAVIADYLARNGIASLRYDDRGCGKSTGSLINTTSIDQAYDALAAINYLRKSEKLKRIGILGHSEGATIAFILGSDLKAAPDFIIGLGAPAVRGDSLLADQNKRLLILNGMPESIATEYKNALLKMYAVAIHDGWKSAFESVDSICSNWDKSPVMKPLKTNLQKISSMADMTLNHMISFSPANSLKSIECPLFAAYGENDVQVSPELNMPAIKRHVPKAYIKLYPSLNHLMQHSRTGNPSEYTEIEETISPEVLHDIVSFIHKERR